MTTYFFSFLKDVYLYSIYFKQTLFYHIYIVQIYYTDNRRNMLRITNIMEKASEERAISTTLFLDVVQAFDLV